MAIPTETTDFDDPAQWFDATLIAKLRETERENGTVLCVVKCHYSVDKPTGTCDFYDLDEEDQEAFTTKLIDDALAGKYQVLILMWLSPSEDLPFRFVMSSSTGLPAFLLFNSADIKELNSGKWIDDIRREYARLAPN